MKRALDFRTGDEVITEIESLRAKGYTPGKNWNLTQICEHLTKTMVGGMEGFGFRLPKILRATIVKWMFQRMLRKRQMPSAPTHPRLKPETSAGQDRDVVIDECIATLRRAMNFPGPIEDYPFLDDLPVEDWRQFMWMHAAHHLGFLHPKD